MLGSNKYINLILFFLHMNFATPWAQEQTREQKVLQCAQCHKTVYDNWKKDSHSQAFKNLEGHVKDIEVNPGKYPKNWKKYVKTQFVYCLNCHVADNMHENLLKGGDQAPSLAEFIRGKNLYRDMKARKDKGSHHLGVDCLTCHVQNGQVLTNENYKPKLNVKRDKDFCRPQPSKTFSSYFSCHGCHVDQAVSYSQFKGRPEFPKTQHCNQCHLQSENKVKNSHLFSTQNLFHKGRKTKYFQEMLDDLKVNLVEDGKLQYLQIRWQNKYMPHIKTDCPEIVAKIEILDSKKKSVFETTLRINRKNYFDHYIATQTKDTIPTGTAGDDFAPGGQGFNKKISIPGKKINKGIIRITFNSKTQYYIDDQWGTIIHKREEPIR